jgi:hypothetical protein
VSPYDQRENIKSFESCEREIERDTFSVKCPGHYHADIRGLSQRLDCRFFLGAATVTIANWMFHFGFATVYGSRQCIIAVDPGTWSNANVCRVLSLTWGNRGWILKVVRPKAKSESKNNNSMLIHLAAQPHPFAMNVRRK